MHEKINAIVTSENGNVLICTQEDISIEIENQLQKLKAKKKTEQLEQC